MGEVYRARDTKLNRDVALKVLPDQFALDADRLTRFKREAQMLAALNHPNIAAIYGFEDSSAEHALVLELVDGPTLADIIAAWSAEGWTRRSPSRDRSLTRWKRHMTKASSIVISSQPTSRSPSNGSVKVLDFGLAKVWEGAPGAMLSGVPTVTSSHLGERAILGTPAYMSPEQARGRTLDKRTDIWSFGCVLFEMLTAPYRIRRRDDIRYHRARSRAGRRLGRRFLHRSRPRIRDLLIRRCLQKDPNRRLRDIGDARIELDEVLTAPAGRECRCGLWSSARGSALRRPLLLAAAVAGVVIGVSRRRQHSSHRGIRDEIQPVFQQLTFKHGSLRGARLATDGQTVVYSAAWIDTPPQVYVIRPESPQSGSVGLTDAGVFSVSSKGELAVALGCRLNWGECTGTLARVPITGGTPRELVKDVHVADWSPDGENIAVVSFAGGRYPAGVPARQGPVRAGGLDHLRACLAGRRSHRVPGSSASR